ncbi:hypothetical protein [Desulfofustis limnaeus]|uniref:Uncharacterized protein n=1 Tax=Desulfofustis limnaeus TaxID=2740163 RepID=A0ABN6M9Q1_9BACT|nr:hypothetical protein [Desulfofustis limnaeus]BDD88695.1 hypothetical protein DPPLL_30600 [Desulfofustis limnaeus]
MSNRRRLKLAAYALRDLQNFRSLLADMKRKEVSADEALAQVDLVFPDPSLAVREVAAETGKERLCPSCGRFVMVPPKGVREPVLICPACRFSVYEGVR